MDLSKIVSNAAAIRAFELANETPEQTAARLEREAEFAAKIEASEMAHILPVKTDGND